MRAHLFATLCKEIQSKCDRTEVRKGRWGDCGAPAGEGVDGELGGEKHDEDEVQASNEGARDGPGGRSGNGLGVYDDEAEVLRAAAMCARAPQTSHRR